MAGKVVIDDGFTLDGTIPARGNLYPEVKFKYRPASPIDQYEFQLADKDTGKKYLAATIKLLLKYLVSWDVTENKPGIDLPQEIKITEQTLCKTNPVILDLLRNHITGYLYEERVEDEKN